MNDEECGFNTLQEHFYRVETGNSKYRLILRCRQDARARFAQLRSDVLVKLELLENKKSQDVAFQLRRFIEGLAVYHNQSIEHLNENANLFPVEVDLSQNAFQYKSTNQIIQDEEEDIEYGHEIKEYHDIKQNNQKTLSRHHDRDRTTPGETEQLLSTEQPVATSEQRVATSEKRVSISEQPVAITEKLVTGLLDSDNNDNSDNLTLLTELGLSDFGEFQNGSKNENKNIDIDNESDDYFEKFLSEMCTR